MAWWAMMQLMYSFACLAEGSAPLPHGVGWLRQAVASSGGGRGSPEKLRP